MCSAVCLPIGRELLPGPEHGFSHEATTMYACKDDLHLLGISDYWDNTPDVSGHLNL